MTDDKNIIDKKSREEELQALENRHVDRRVEDKGSPCLLYTSPSPRDRG